MKTITLGFIHLTLIMLILGCSKDENTTGPPSINELYLSQITWEEGYEEYIYNSNNNVERYNYYHGSDGLSHTIYDYNSSNQITIITYYNDDGNSYYHEELIYEGNKIIESRGFESDNEEYSLTTYEYEGNNIIEVYRYSDSEYPAFENYYKYYVYTYEDDNLINVKKYNAEDQLISEYSYDYDDRNSAYYFVNTIRILWDDDTPFVGDHNIISCVYDYFDEEDNTWYQRIYSYNYIYNESDFPTNVTRTVSQGNESYSDTYVFEYSEYINQ